VQSSRDSTGGANGNAIPNHSSSFARSLSSPVAATPITNGAATQSAKPKLVLQRVLDPASQSTAVSSVSAPVYRDEQSSSEAIPIAKKSACDEPVAESGADLDWIADEVGRRLAQRLEVERERRGLRRWR
jgi:hypothetical protein